MNMVDYVRDTKTKARRDDEQIVGAYLVKANNPNEVDSWHASCEIADLLKRNPQYVIYGGSPEEIESELWKRHPVEGSECTLITSRYEGLWDIERVPRLLHKGFDALHSACAIHGRVLVGSSIFDEMGGLTGLHDRGFMAQTRNSRSAFLVRFNPKAVVLKDWRSKVASVRVFLQPELPPELTIELFDAVIPDNYPDSHPYAGKLSSEEFVTESQRDAGSRWGRRGRSSKDRNLEEAPDVILRYAWIAKRLSHGRQRHPWRSGKAWKSVLRQAVQYLHGLEGGKTGSWPKLARWLRRESRAARLRIPPRKKLPPKPAFRRRPSRKRKQAPKRVRRR
jgi:hypothetical protein